VDTATPADAANAEAPQQLAPGEVPPACEGSLRLIASLYFERTPDWSFATISTGADAPLLYRTGGRVADMEVFSVLPKAVFLRLANGRLCSILLFPDPNARTATAQPVTVPANPMPGAMPMPSPTGEISEQDMDQNINAQGETKFTVQRSFVDKILQNQAEIMRSARIVPHEENGQVVGVKLYGIRRNSLLGKLGLQNGDLLRTINGFAMSSPDTALEAYSRLRTATNLSVAVTRRGRDMSVDYDIKGAKP
jgi:general secretion pathway protein C